MPTGTPPDCSCIGSYPPEQVQLWIYCLLAAGNGLLESINEAVGGGTDSDQFASTFDNATADGSIPAGVLGWSITAVSGTVTVQGQALPNGASTRGGGYGGKTTSAAVPYTVTGGAALVSYDTPT